MVKLEDKSNKKLKGNSSDTLLPIYILRILKNNSSPNNQITAKQLYDYLIEKKYIDSSEDEKSQIKKIRRHLETLHASYGKGCIQKEEGKSKREGNKWYYDATLDDFANENLVVQETLSDVEIGFLVELVSATKILNSDSTHGMIDKLLKKTSLSYEERVKKLKALKKEGWLKTPNDDLVQKKARIEDVGKVLVEFNYEGNKIIATPIDWVDKNGVCYLKVIVGEKQRLFALDKIRDYEEADSNDIYDDSFSFSKGSESNKTALDSLFANIPILNAAIEQRREISFVYLSYVVRNNKVEPQERTKNVLPHSLVFNDGKYYLIGIDEDAPEKNKVAYFRVDLMMDLEFSNRKIKLSDWNSEKFDSINRVTEISKHPLMIADQDIPVKFLVIESALDRVIDAFGLDIKNFRVTNQTKTVYQLSSRPNWTMIAIDEDLPRERLVEFTVRTSKEEAYRWALANADVAELVSPQNIRNELRWIATPINQTYTHTIEDKVKEHVEDILESGILETAYIENDDLMFAIFQELNRQKKTDVVERLTIYEANKEPENYFGEFSSVKYLDIVHSPKCKNPLWASNLTNARTLKIDHTQIENISWAKEMKKLIDVEISESPISDLSVLSDNANVRALQLSDLDITDISFIEKYHHLTFLELVRCPINDYSPLLKIKPLEYLVIDENAVEFLGMDNIKKHHPNAKIVIMQDNN